VLTGTSMALANALGIRDGFGFSAGLFDYVLNFNIATKPLWLIVMGLGYAAVYYLLFRWVIRKWNLRTPGREDDDDDAVTPDPLADADAGKGAPGDFGTGTGDQTDAEKVGAGAAER
jgi:N-acetylglucosamine PTS system EIICBA or EIICB component